MPDNNPAMAPINEPLAEADGIWNDYWTLLNAFASGKTQESFARVEPLAVLSEAYAMGAQLHALHKKIKEAAELLSERSRVNTALMMEAGDKMDELRQERDRLRAELERRDSDAEDALTIDRD